MGQQIASEIPDYASSCNQLLQTVFVVMELNCARGLDLIFCTQPFEEITYSIYMQRNQKTLVLFTL